MRATYDRNSFSAILAQARKHGLELRDKRLLSIGERQPDPKVVEASRQGFQVTVLEAFPANIENVRSKMPDWRFIHMDCADMPGHDSELHIGRYDIIWWYHGPEHLAKEVGMGLFKFFKRRARFVISSMPHGAYEQKELNGNPYEKHASAWRGEDFQGLGGAVYVESFKGDDKSSLDVFIKGEGA